jgi:hypothetical protein
MSTDKFFATAGHKPTRIKNGLLDSWINGQMGGETRIARTFTKLVAGRERFDDSKNRRASATMGNLRPHATPFNRERAKLSFFSDPFISFLQSV